MPGLLDPSQSFRGLLAQSPAAQGQLQGLQPPPQYGAQLPNRSVPLWFGGALPKGQGTGTAPWVSPQQNSYWPQILALLQNPLLLPQGPGVQPIPQLPIPGMPQLPPVFPGGGALPPGSTPPPTPGTGGAGTVMPPTNTIPQPAPLPGTTPLPGITPIPTPTPTPVPAPVPVVKKKVTGAFGAGVNTGGKK